MLIIGGGGGGGRKKERKLPDTWPDVHRHEI